MSSRILAVMGVGLLWVGAAAADDRRVELAMFPGEAPARLGVQLDDVGADDLGRLKLAQEKGAVVQSVDDDSPAARAGLREDDVVLAFDGETVRSAAALARMVRETPPGRTVALEVSRDGARQRLTVELEKARPFPGRLGTAGAPFPALPGLHERAARPMVHAFGMPPRRLGVGYQDVRGEEAEKRGARGGGVLVTSVEEASPAARAGLKEGDVIVAIGPTTVRDGQSLRRHVMGAADEIVVSVVRGGETLEKTLRFRE
jgi:serine protease Do